jgi:hypothetical protein
VSALEREAAYAARCEAQRVAEQQARDELTARVSEQLRREYYASEMGAIRRANDEAYRVMRLPTPEALKALGAVVSDPATPFGGP